MQSIPWPDPANPPQACKIDLTDGGRGWTCAAHDVERGSGLYTEGMQFNIGQMVYDIVVHVGEETTRGALRSIILDLGMNALMEIEMEIEKVDTMRAMGVDNE